MIDAFPRKINWYHDSELTKSTEWILLHASRSLIALYLNILLQILIGLYMRCKKKKKNSCRDIPMLPFFWRILLHYSIISLLDFINPIQSWNKIISKLFYNQLQSRSIMLWQPRVLSGQQLAKNCFARLRSSYRDKMRRVFLSYRAMHQVSSRMYEMKKKNREIRG